MAEQSSRDKLTSDWWGRWRSADFSWAGLADKPWQGWLVADDGRMVRVEELPSAQKDLEPGWRPASLQDYWRSEEGQLIPGDGKLWTRVHCPLNWADGTPTPKRSWTETECASVERLLGDMLGAASDLHATLSRKTAPDEALGQTSSAVASDADEKVRAAQGSGFMDLYLSMRAKTEELTLADRRAQLQGVVLLAAPTHPKEKKKEEGPQIFVALRRDVDEESMLLARFDRAFFFGTTNFERKDFAKDARFNDAAFGADVNFTGAVFSGDASFAGAAFLGRAAFDGSRFAGVVRFNSATFARQASLREASFDLEASFESVEFRAEAVFTSAKFSGGSMFARSHFNDSADFSSSEHSDSASFTHVKFDKEARFEGVNIEGTLYVSSARFASRASFSGATLGGARFKETVFSYLTTFERASIGACRFDEVKFEADVVFRGAAFRGIVDFKETEFAEEVIFYLTEFAEQANFQGANFKGNLGFDTAKFDKDVNFDQVVFNGDVSIAGATFADLASFSGAVFAGGLNGSGASFRGMAKFQNVAFRRGAGFADATLHQANFVAATFDEASEFTGAKFVEDARFDRVNFSNMVSFRAAIFQGLAGFDGATFAAEVHFTSAEFENRLSFNHAVFQKPAFFGVGFPDEPAHYFASFHGARFVDVADFGALAREGTAARVVAAFDEAIFERKLLLEDPTEARANRDFSNHVLRRLQSSATLIAQLALDPARDGGGADLGSRETVRRDAYERLLRELEGGCRAVKVAMGRERDEQMEQRYYRFQLIARRKQRGTPLAEKLYSSLYAGFSDYGMGLWQPFVTLLFMVLGFGALYWGWGELLQGGEASAACFGIQCHVDPDFWDAMMFSANNVFRPFGVWGSTFEGGDDGRWIPGFLNAFRDTGEGHWMRLLIRLVASLQSLLSVILFFLFGLAVRRRFQIG